MVTSDRTEPLVLLVDDDHDQRELVRELLEHAGYVVVARPNGMAALEYLRSDSERPSVIITDLMMPEMRGDELVLAIRAVPGSPLATIPVIVATASDTSGFKATGVDLVRKPIAPESLVALVERLRKSDGPTG